MKTYLELQEVKLLEEQASNVRDRLLIRMLFHLGCRVSEALALAVEDIDFVRSTVTIQHLEDPTEALLHRVRTETWQKPYILPKMRKQGREGSS